MNENNIKGKRGIPEEKGGDGDIRALVKRCVSEALEDMKKSFGKDIETRIAAEREDAAKMATMTSDERARAEIEKSRREFEDEKAMYVSERAEFEAAKELTAQNLPVTFARFVADGDKDVMLENISAFKTEYLKAIEAGLSDRLKGRLPRVSKEKEQPSDPFLNGLGF